MHSVIRSGRLAAQKGFTLVELLIVAIILAVLAAIVIPQFSSSTADAKESALDADLNVMRSAIELYRAQHGGKYPGATVSSGLTCTTGTAGTAAVNTSASLTDQLTKYSNAAGATCTGADTQTPYGPYLRKGIPAEPITGSTAIAVSNAGVPLAPAAATGGWAYDTVTGQIVMNSSANDSKNAAFSTH
ncbi:MAG: type II secretion system protein [Betaproteobacteria bacterium]|nr:type II secretion system protein [Betaproteobacteria bacterium]